MYWIPGKYLRFRVKGGGGGKKVEKRGREGGGKERKLISREKRESRTGLRRALKAKGSEEALAPEIRTF